MTEILMLQDGTELFGWAEEFGGKLHVYIFGNKYSEIRKLLRDRTKTSRIISVRNRGTIVYEGYIHMESLTEVDEQFIAATLLHET